ncbi:MAG: Holliday junction resolvase RuvX [Deltaproteobacteria bacterium]|nr:Holliday junction resolvase RuvX [Deltaproteobacteria bacterium]
MTVLLALDVGDKRVGIAMAGAGSSMATPHSTVERAAGRAEREILALIKQHKIERMVVGLPLSDDGQKNEQCLKVERFCRRLQKRVQVDIQFVDEYASSYEAEEKLRSAGVSGRQLKKDGFLDAASAAVILQSFLDAQRT